MASDAAVATPSAPLTIQQAFAESKAEHSAPAEHASPEPTRTDPEPEPAPSQHTETPGATADRVEPSPTDLISDGDFQAIQAKFPTDPAKQRSELNRVWTQKTQALAEQRKALEPYADIIDTLEDETRTDDARAIVQALADRYGLAVQPRESTAVKPAVDAAVEQFRTALGPDLDFLADKLAPAFQQLAESVAAQTVERNIAPLAASQEQIISRAAHEQTASVMSSFSAKHPDWNQHEAQMMALGARLQPNGMSEDEYLDTLYVLATRDVATGEAAKQAVARMVKAASEADASVRALPERQVERDPNRRLTLREAFEEAKREHGTR